MYVRPVLQCTQFLMQDYRIRLIYRLECRLYLAGPCLGVEAALPLGDWGVTVQQPEPSPTWCQVIPDFQPASQPDSKQASKLNSQ